VPEPNLFTDKKLHGENNQRAILNPVVDTTDAVYTVRRMENSSPKSRMIQAALDLLSQSGLSGLDVKQVAAATGASTASVQRLFPGGKVELAVAALEQAQQGIGQWFRAVFQQRKSIAEKVESLFADAAKNVEASGFTKGCPAAAVTLDIDSDSGQLGAVCRAIFVSWQDIIAMGLQEIPQARRSETAELILATLEGALILSRASATKEPLLSAGRSLGGLLAQKLSPSPSRPPAKRRRRKK
jgi:TetR/AcrR family transcriptional repressor of lmrAB and yxaGH operons